jgi:hypothetical protein
VHWQLSSEIILQFITRFPYSHFMQGEFVITSIICCSQWINRPWLCCHRFLNTWKIPELWLVIDLEIMTQLIFDYAKLWQYVWLWCLPTSQDINQTQQDKSLNLEKKVKLWAWPGLAAVECYSPSNLPYSPGQGIHQVKYDKNHKVNIKCSNITSWCVKCMYSYLTT